MFLHVCKTKKNSHTFRLKKKTKQNKSLIQCYKLACELFHWIPRSLCVSYHTTLQISYFYNPVSLSNHTTESPYLSTGDTRHSLILQKVKKTVSSFMMFVTGDKLHIQSKKDSIQVRAVTFTRICIWLHGRSYTKQFLVPETVLKSF